MDTKNIVGVVIDPGHGGSDPGAVANNRNEKDYTLLISKYMYDRFRELGIPVALTRDTDTTLDPTERVEDILKKFGNNPNVIVISNHLNAGGGTGAEVIYALRDTSNLANKVLDNIASTGQTVRKAYQRRLPSDTSKDYYFIHRNTGVTEPILVEYGFIDDTPSNVNFLENNYKQLAEAVIEAVADYKGLPYTSPFTNTSNIYVVKAGDSLYSIARIYDTTVDELKRLNNLTSNSLTIGQRLKVPSKTSTNDNIYTVKAGDSLYSIARNFDTTVATLRELNNLSSDVLSIGQILIVREIPNDEGVTIPEGNYIVKAGDSLYSIAREYNTTVDELKRLNNLSNNLLSIGQSLIIPTEETVTPNEESYVVQKGDSLYSIAKKFNTSVNELQVLNNLSNNLLSIGQILKIPTSNNQNVYTVQRGDSLYSIAKKFDTTVNNLKALNNLNNNLLSIGQKLIIS